MTEHLVARVKLARQPDAVLLTTSIHPDDAVLCQLAAKAGIESFRGSEQDKLERYRDAARARGVDFMVIVDGDDIFCSEEHIDQTIAAYRATGAEYITQTGLPLGAACFGVSRQAIEKVCAVKAEDDTEVWGEYFTKTGLFRCHFIDESDPLLRRPDVRMTLDYEEDLEFFTAVMDLLYGNDGAVPSFRSIMSLLASRPDIVALNQKAGERYAAHLAKSAPVRLKKGLEQ